MKMSVSEARMTASAISGGSERAPERKFCAVHAQRREWKGIPAMRYGRFMADSSYPAKRIGQTAQRPDHVFVQSVKAVEAFADHDDSFAGLEPRWNWYDDPRGFATDFEVKRLGRLPHPLHVRIRCLVHR